MRVNVGQPVELRRGADRQRAGRAVHRRLAPERPVAVRHRHQLEDRQRHARRAGSSTPPAGRAGTSSPSSPARASHVSLSNLPVTTTSSCSRTSGRRTPRSPSGPPPDLTRLTAEFASADVANAFTSNAFTSNAFTSNAFTSNAFTSNAFTSNAFTSNAFTSNAFTSNAFTSQRLHVECLHVQRVHVQCLHVQRVHVQCVHVERLHVQCLHVERLVQPVRGEPGRLLERPAPKRHRRIRQHRDRVGVVRRQHVDEHGHVLRPRQRQGRCLERPAVHALGPAQRQYLRRRQPHPGFVHRAGVGRQDPGPVGLQPHAVGPGR